VEQANAAVADLLRLCAFLALEAIPEDLFTQAASELGPSLQAVAANPLAFNEALGELLKYSLLKRDPANRSVTVHRLVQDVLKDAMPPEAHPHWTERVTKALNHVFPYVTFEAWSRCERYLPHALVCARLIEQYTLSLPKAARLLNSAGYYLEARGRYREALPLYQRALAICEQELGSVHPTTTRIQENYALFLQEMKRQQSSQSTT